MKLCMGAASDEINAAQICSDSALVRYLWSVMTVRENRFDLTAFDADAVLGWYDQHARIAVARAQS